MRQRGQSGFCTASSNSNGRQQDWLACPVRGFDPPFTLLRAVVRRLFRITAGEAVLLRPMSALATDAVDQVVVDGLGTEDTRVFLYAQHKLGAEAREPETAGSPKIGENESIRELIGVDTGGFRLGLRLFFELQTRLAFASAGRGLLRQEEEG